MYGPPFDYALLLFLSLLYSPAEQNCGEMAELGVVSPLVGLLSSPAKATRSYSALCLSDMTTSGSEWEREGGRVGERGREDGREWEGGREGERGD